MTSQKLPRVLQIIGDSLEEENIPYALIGALALSYYGLPKYTSDIDLLTEGYFRRSVFPIMESLGYTCFQETKSFAQFDSELGVLGKIDFMFVHSPEGKGILTRSVLCKDELFGEQPVVQPSDYIILKLMAIANNPDRTLKDGGDILEVLRLHGRLLLSERFEPLDRKRIELFAARFGQADTMESLFNQIEIRPDSQEKCEL
jgi:hypothetical protein